MHAKYEQFVIVCDFGDGSHWVVAAHYFQNRMSIHVVSSQGEQFAMRMGLTIDGFTGGYHRDPRDLGSATRL